MNKFHPFFIIGTIGTIVTALLHMFFALVLSLNTVHTTFTVLYGAFTVFMFIGVRLSALKLKR